MVEFSNEYYEIEKVNLKGNFSIEEIFQKLKPNTSESRICEGLGELLIMDKDEECFIKFSDGSIKSYEELTGRVIEKKDFKAIRIGLIVIGAWLLSWLILEIVYEGHPKIGEFGDMFGAINALFSGLAFVGVIYAIILQRKELRLQRSELRQTREEFKIQNDTLAKQRFENTFFQLVELHHEIIDKLQFGETFSKRQVLAHAHSQLSLFIEYEIEHTYEKKIMEKDVWNCIQTAYQRFFYNGSFGSHLSHYFRNLYHIFKFIHKNNALTPDEKQDYASIVRAQLSQSELFILFYNAMYEYHGNPKFLFLTEKYNILDNFDFDAVSKFQYHVSTFHYLINNVDDCINDKSPEPIIPN